MITAITTDLDTPVDTIKKIHGETNNIRYELPKQIREQLLEMKLDVTAQMKEKKRKIYISHQGLRVSMKESQS
jgi:hypothetical protein